MIEEMTNTTRLEETGLEIEGAQEIGARGGAVATEAEITCQDE